MGTYVTDTGFQKRTLAEIKLDLEGDFQQVFGDDIDLDAEGVFGQLIGLLAKREANLWDLAEEIYQSRDPSGATGISLDNLSAEIGVTRIAAGATTVSGVLIYGTDGTAVPVTFQARQPGGTVDYQINSGITIDDATARDVLLAPATPSGGGGEVYTVTIDSVPYSYTALPGDTEATVVNDLVSQITGGAWGGTASNESDKLRLQRFSVDFSLVFTATLTLEQLASAGDFTATTTGANALPANTLTEIVTPEPGVDAVTNPSAGSTGRAEETDAELRIRRDQTLLAGLSTEEAIRTQLLNRVENIQQASVGSNRTLTGDGDGRPPKSLEAVVEGGTDEDIGQVIWESAPGGIEIFGSTLVVVVDSEGNNQNVYFSRPTAVYIHVNIVGTLYSEEEYPTDGDDAVKAAIVAWAATNQGIGVDVIRQRLNIPIYSIPGIGPITVEIDGTPNPGDSPTFAEQDVAIASREFASFDTSRIFVSIT